MNDKGASMMSTEINIFKIKINELSTYLIRNKSFSKPLSQLLYRKGDFLFSKSETSISGDERKPPHMEVSLYLDRVENFV